MLKTLQKYIVEYWWYDSNEMADYEHLSVVAKNNKQAIEKAKSLASTRRRGARSFTIV